MKPSSAPGPATSAAPPKAPAEHWPKDTLLGRALTPVLDMLKGLRELFAPTPMPSGANERSNWYDGLTPEAQHAVEAARQRAAAAGRSEPSFSDLLVALLHDESVAALLQQVRIDVAGLTERASAHVVVATAEHRVYQLVVTAAAHARLSGKVAGSRALLAHLARFADPLEELLFEHGLDKGRILRLICHGVLDHPSLDDDSAPPGEIVEVVMHNDDYTPMETVLEVLEKHCGYDEEQCNALMMRVHEEGEAWIDSRPRAGAIELANAILDDAHDAAMPLKVTLRAAAPKS